MDSELVRMALAAAGAAHESLSADEAWCSVTSRQAEAIVQKVHRTYRPDWRPFLLQLERYLETAPQGSGTLLTFEVSRCGQVHSVLLILVVNDPIHRLAFLAEDEQVMKDLRELCPSANCF